MGIENMAAPHYNVFTGSETGLLKGIDLEKRSFVNLNAVDDVKRENEICIMCWGDDHENEICIGLRNQTILQYDIQNDKFLEPLAVSGGEGPLKGLSKYNNCMLTCVESGVVKVWTEEDEHKIELNTGGNTARMRQNMQKLNVIATGGEENDLKLWDLEAPQIPIFQAKNVPHDFLNLRVPIWILDMQFLPSSEKVIACTGHHQVRLYDPASPQRRPVINMECGEHPLMSISLSHNENNVLVGNSRGYLHLLDLRKKSLVHSFKGFAGSIRCVQCHPTLPLVASCGLDRFIRIHDLHSRKLLHKIYLKSRLNWLLLKTEFRESIPSVDKESDVENDQDELWHDMEIISESVKRKQKTSNNKIKKKKNKS